MNKNYLGNTTIESFVDNLPQESFIRPQKYKFINKKGVNGMDFIINYDRLETELNYVIRQIGIEDLDVQLPHSNKSSNVRIKREDLGQSTEAKIKNFFYEDYIFFENAQKTQMSLV